MQEDNTTPAGQADASQLNAAAPAGTVGNVAPASAPSATEADGMTLKELNESLGKNFKDKASAIKSLKDTFSYVGKKVEDVRKDLMAEVRTNDATDRLSKELEEVRKERFYDKNPQYADPDTRKLIERIGGNPSDVTNSPEFKAIFTKASGYDETQKLKTVLESNPRLSSSRDNLTKARELSQTAGADRGKTREEVERLAVSAVQAVRG